MSFVLHDVFKAADQLQQMSHPLDLDEDLINAILDEGGKFCSQVLDPINRNGDEQGCTLQGDTVVTPDGFKQAFKQFSESGWGSFYANPEFGGQGMPKTLHVLLDEMLRSANSSFILYASLTTGAMHAIESHASEAIKRTWLPSMAEGKWSGTMCLTEAHAGTDLGLIKTRAAVIDEAKGEYKITGTKIFITGGEQDLTENIVHLVLARMEGAVEGVKGISLFVVPKFLLDDNGNPSQRNTVSVGSIEHKMGIKASATCVMNFDGATGYLVGEANKGLIYMFSMMNNERLSVGIQGLGLAERSLQTATAYAKERLQSRGPLMNSTGPDAIIEHPDVRRMLMWMRSHIEASRVSAVWMGLEIDKSKYLEDQSARKQAKTLVAFLTPVAKAFYTDFGFQACCHGMQVLGGHGYIREWGQEQHVRDAKIAQIYEGTNGIQALDLIGRKLIHDGGEGYQLFDQWLSESIQSISNNELVNKLLEAQQSLQQATHWLLDESKSRPALAGAAATDYLELTGICWFSGMWALSLNALDNSSYLSTSEKQQKRTMASFFCNKVLIKHSMLLHSIMHGEEDLMALNAEQF